MLAQIFHSNTVQIGGFRTTRLVFFYILIWRRLLRERSEGVGARPSNQENPLLLPPGQQRGFFPRIWVESVYNSTQALWPPQWWQLKLIQFIWQCYIAKNVFIFLSTITVTLLCEDLVLTTRHSRSSDTTNISGDGFSMIEDGGKSRKATFIHRVKI